MEDESIQIYYSPMTLCNEFFPLPNDAWNKIQNLYKLMLQKCKRLHSQRIKIPERRIKREQQLKCKYPIKWKSVITNVKFDGSYVEYKSNGTLYFQQL